MALDEEQPSEALESGLSVEWLSECQDLGGVDRDALRALAAGAIHFSLPAGSLLFESGSASDGVYLLASGRLGVKTPGKAGLTAEIERGELVGEAGWLLRQQRSATVVALRDSEVLLLPGAELDRVAAQSTHFSMALARLCARRLRHSNRQDNKPKRARVLALIPNSLEVDVAELATALVDELARLGRAELVWDVRATTHTAAWFNRVEELNDYVVYVADCTASGWTRQCSRQADVVLMLADAHLDQRPWPSGVAELAVARGARVDLVLLHDQSVVIGAAARWLEGLPASLHHQIVDRDDIGRMARLLTRRGVGLVLSGGGARGFAHLGVIRALREARVPIDFVGGSSIGGIIAAGVAMGWDDEEMQHRYRRSFVATNPVNDYTFPFVGLTRGRKVSRLLEREYGDTLIEDLRQPFFCVSANLTSGKTHEHRAGNLAQALRATVAIPGIMPPVFREVGVLVDGAVINNLPVDIMHTHTPGFVIGCDVGSDRSFGQSRINILQILTRAGMVNSTSAAAAQRELADLLLKPPLPEVDLLDWQAFDRAVEAGYRYAGEAVAGATQLPRLSARTTQAVRATSLEAELDRRVTRLAT
ncbi:MAG TPA: patatin-like phospholipase family protein [Steroidobacteraceae bacterium]|jgi:NTE family protein